MNKFEENQIHNVHEFSESEVRQKEFYAELTDPSEHDPSHYCYIVHGLNPMAKQHLLLATMKQNGYDFSQEIDLLNEPQKIAEKKLISTSIINQNHNATWGDVFFILDVPWDNFVSMSPRDNATNVTNPDFVLECARHPNMVPSELIKQTKFLGGNSSYNEVVVTGKKNDKEAKIKGIGIKLTDVGDETPREAKEAIRMREIAEELGVPVIEIIEKQRIEDSDAEINYGYSKNKPIRSIYVNKDGHRYCFEGNWDETKLKDVFKGDKNFYGGHNLISKEEYLVLRPLIRKKLSTKTELDFLKQIDQKFGLELPDDLHKQ